MYVVFLGLVKVFDEMPHQALKRGSIVVVKVFSFVGCTHRPHYHMNNWKKCTLVNSVVWFVFTFIVLYGLVGKRFREFVCDFVRVDDVCIFVCVDRC